MIEEGGMVKREWYRDRYNSKKTWEVVKMVGGYYLRQYINGQQENTLIAKISRNIKMMFSA